MTAADWLIVVVVLLNVVSAAVQGFFAEALSMAGLVIGYIVAAWQYQRLAGWFMSFLKNEWLAEIFGFLIIFFAILVLFSIAGRIARKLMKEVGLSGFDRFLGALLGHNVVDIGRGQDAARPDRNRRRRTRGRCRSRGSSGTCARG